MKEIGRCEPEIVEVHRTYLQLPIRPAPNAEFSPNAHRGCTSLPYNCWRVGKGRGWGGECSSLSNKFCFWEDRIIVPDFWIDSNSKCIRTKLFSLVIAFLHWWQSFFCEGHFAPYLIKWKCIQILIFSASEGQHVQGDLNEIREVMRCLHLNYNA